MNAFSNVVGKNWWKKLVGKKTDVEKQRIESISGSPF